jgi:hypothetical protein
MMRAFPPRNNEFTAAFLEAVVSPEFVRKWAAIFSADTTNGDLIRG